MEFGRNNTPFDKAEFAARLARTKARMAAAELEALMVADPANMNYLTGYNGWSFYTPQVVIVSDALSGRSASCAAWTPMAPVTTFLKHENIIGYPDHHVQSPDRHAMDTSPTC